MDVVADKSVINPSIEASGVLESEPVTGEDGELITDYAISDEDCRVRCEGVSHNLVRVTTAEERICLTCSSDLRIKLWDGHEWIKAGELIHGTNIACDRPLHAGINLVHDRPFHGIRPVAVVSVTRLEHGGQVKSVVNQAGVEIGPDEHAAPHSFYCNEILCISPRADCSCPCDICTQHEDTVVPASTSMCMVCMVNPVAVI